MRSLDDTIKAFPQAWADADEDKLGFVDLAYYRGHITPEEYVAFMAELESPVTEAPPRPTPTEVMTTAEQEQLRAKLAQEAFELQRPWYEMSIRQILKEFWEWLKANVTEFLDMVWGHIKSTLIPLLERANAAIDKYGRETYNFFEGLLLKRGPITPEDAPALGVKMFTLALSAGIGAHVMSMGLQLFPPFKQIGLTQLTGILAQLGSFGPVFAATVGVVQYGALRRPMQYAVNAVTRSQLPDEMTLQIMAVKPDITLEQFRDTMKYHGYSDYWIDRIEATMYHEPRYFELKMMSEDESASEEWLWNKSRRAGFNEADTKIMVSSYIKGATRMQRLDYYKQAFYLYKEGLMSREAFDKELDALELREDAKKFSARAAELAYLQSFLKQYVRYWVDSYLKDIISDDDLATHLSLLGMVPGRVSLTVGLAKVRKRRRPAKEEPPDLEPIMAKARTQYSQAYVTLYRKELIDLASLESYLVQLGIHPELAAATCALEAARAATPIA